MAGSDRRQAILAAAIGLMRERPFREITVDLVADSAGVTRGLVLYYFSTRDNLFLQVLTEYLQDVRRLFGPPPSRPNGEWIIGEIDVFLDLSERDTVILESTMTAMGAIEGAPAVLDHMGAFTASRIASALGAPQDHPLLTAVLQAWARGCVDLAVRASRSGYNDRHRLRAVIVGQLLGAVAAARDSDSSLAFELPLASSLLMN